jgi:hypothetical protein
MGMGATAADVTNFYTGQFAGNTRMVIPWANLNTDNTLQMAIDGICST